MLAKSWVTREIFWLFSFHMCSLHNLSRVLSLEPIVRHVARSTVLINFHQLNTKPITIKSHKIQENKLMQLQHFSSWKKANINVMWKTIRTISPFGYSMTKHPITNSRLKRKFRNKDKTHAHLNFKTCDELGTYIPITWNTCTKHIIPSR